jgi:hypothetical protein
VTRAKPIITRHLRGHEHERVADRAPEEVARAGGGLEVVAALEQRRVVVEADEMALAGIEVVAAGDRVHHVHRERQQREEEDHREVGQEEDHGRRRMPSSLCSPRHQGLHRARRKRRDRPEEPDAAAHLPAAWMASSTSFL